MKKIHLLLIFLLLSFSSASYAFIEKWTDAQVCNWVIGDENFVGFEFDSSTASSYAKD